MIEPQKWASALGSLSDTVTLPDEDLQFASFKKLFPALTQVPLSEGGVAPQRTDFNTLFKLLGDNIFYIQQGGVFSYSDTADYERGAFVKYNNELYLCIQDNSSSNKHAPTDAEEYWKKVATEDFVNTSINNLNIIRKNNGNDYYDDSDITSLIYAGNGAGTLRAQIAQGDFRNVHPGDYIIGKSTGTKWIVAHNDYWFNRGDSPLTRHHLCLIPEILAGNSGNLLWSGRTYAGSGVNNTDQGYAPWASDNWSEGKNNTSGAYYNSFIKQSILPKVYTYWLKKDFEDQGISLLMKPTPTHLQKVTQPGAAPAPHGHGMTASATSFQRLTFTAIIIGSLQVLTVVHRKNSLLFSSLDIPLRCGAEETYGSRM